MSILDFFAKIIESTSWPITLIWIIFLIRKEITSLFASISNRIKDNETNLSITTDGLEIKKAIDATDARLATIRAEQAQLSAIALNPLASVRTDYISAFNQIKEIAINYENIKVSNHKERIALKNAASQAIAFIIIANKLNKDALKNEHLEGIFAGLADSIILNPDQEDFDRLRQVALKSNRLHVRYRIALGFSKLIETELIKSEQLIELNSIISSFLETADPPLNKLLTNIKSLIRNKFRDTSYSND